MHAHPGTVAILVYEGLCVFEFGIALEIFGLPRPELDVAWYDRKSSPSIQDRCMRWAAFG